ncbi:MAG: lamin tail domain-containing protein [Opitutae bacterium]|nr:lamin tail domain-containing protein [Opitutae bacterium]
MYLNRLSYLAVKFGGLLTLLASTLHAQLVFTQYYEGASNNKWLEITNVGAASVDLSAYTVSLYSNAAAENWKSGSTSSSNLALIGTLASGSSFLIAHSSAVLPRASSSANVTTTGVAAFNGNDSLVLWNDQASYSTSRIVDALSFTNAGNEGADRAFVRTSLAAGYNLTAGTSVASYSSVWTQVSNATVDAAVAGTDNYLGYSSLSAVPEPSTYAAIFGGLALVGAIVRRRFARR